MFIVFTVCLQQSFGLPIRITGTFLPWVKHCQHLLWGPSHLLRCADWDRTCYAWNGVTLEKRVRCIEIGHLWGSDLGETWEGAIGLLLGETGSTCRFSNEFQVSLVWDMDQFWLNFCWKSQPLWEIQKRSDQLSESEMLGPDRLVDIGWWLYDWYMTYWESVSSHGTRFSPGSHLGWIHDPHLQSNSAGSGSPIAEVGSQGSPIRSHDSCCLAEKGIRIMWANPGCCGPNMGLLVAEQ